MSAANSGYPGGSGIRQRVASEQAPPGKHDNRWGYALVAAAFLWRIPLALAKQAVRDAGIVVGTWGDSPWAGWLVLVGVATLVLWPTLRLVRHGTRRLIAALGVVWAVPILVRAMLTGYLGLDLGVSLASWPVWLAAWLLLGLTAALANRQGRRMVPWVTVGYGAALATASLVIYYRGHIGTGDLYLYQQMLWTTLHGPGFMYVAEEAGNHFAVHVSPALLALLPGYALWPSGAPLVVLQAAAVAACIPLCYRLLAPLVGESRAVVGAIGFALLPGVTGPALGKFHELSFGLPLLLLAMMGLRQGRGGLFALGCAGMLLVRETFGVVVMVLGIGAWLSRRRRWGAGALGVGLGWLALCYLVVMPACTTAHTRTPYRELYGHLGQTPRQMVTRAVRHPTLLAKHLGRPANRTWAAELSAPLGGPLPLLSWQGWLGVGEALAVMAARTGTAWPVREIHCHYAAIVSAGLWLGMLGALLGLGARRGWTPRVAGLALAASFLFAASQLLPLLPPSMKLISPGQAQARREVLAALPERASVAAPYDMLSALAHRPTVVYNSGHQPATEYVVSLAGQPHQVPASSYRRVGGRGPYTLWRRITSPTPGARRASPPG